MEKISEALKLQIKYENKRDDIMESIISEFCSYFESILKLQNIDCKESEVEKFIFKIANDLSHDIYKFVSDYHYNYDLLDEEENNDN